MRNSPVSDLLQLCLQQVQFLSVNIARKEGHQVCGYRDWLGQGCLGDPEKFSGCHEHHLRPKRKTVNTTDKNSKSKRINGDLKEQERSCAARTDHWLFCVGSVAGSELCRSSPRLRTTRSSDRPNYKRRQRQSHSALHSILQRRGDPGIRRGAG